MVEIERKQRLLITGIFRTWTSFYEVMYGARAQLARLVPKMRTIPNDDEAFHKLFDFLRLYFVVALSITY